MNGVQVFALLVGLVGGLVMLTMASDQRSQTLRWIALGWIALWCIPPLAILWVRAVFS